MASFPTDVGTLRVYAGDTFSQTFVFKEGETVIDLVDEGWTGWAAQYRVTRDAATAISFAVDDSEADEGRITIALSPSQTNQISKAGVFDLQASQNGTVKTWLQGSLAWTRDITRA
jgi:hypothetical protein